jgi:hypothetical protein
MLQGAPATSLNALRKILRAPGSARDKPGNPDNKPESAGKK